MSPENQLILMGAIGLLGAVVSAEIESAQIHFENSHPNGRDLPHGALAFIRLVVVSFIAIWLVGLEWRALTLILFCGCAFGTPHRYLINVFRHKRHPEENKTITWHHLRMKGYDNLLFFIPTERIRFITLCSLELLLALAIYVQASVQ